MNHLPNPLTLSSARAKRNAAELAYWDHLIRSALRDARDAERIQARLLKRHLKRPATVAR